jgi:YHS domain-containing protein
MSILTNGVTDDELIKDWSVGSARERRGADGPIDQAAIRATSNQEKRTMRRKSGPTSLYLFAALCALVLAGLGTATVVHSPAHAEAGQGPIADRSRICMLQDTIQNRPGLPYVYNDKKYYLCRGGCLTAFQQNAPTHSRAIDPVDGGSVDKADALAYAYRGRAYFFASAQRSSPTSLKSFSQTHPLRQTEDERGAGAASPSCRSRCRVSALDCESWPAQSLAPRLRTSAAGKVSTI